MCCDLSMEVQHTSGMKGLGHKVQFSTVQELVLKLVRQTTCSWLWAEALVNPIVYPW